MSEFRLCPSNSFDKTIFLDNSQRFDGGFSYVRSFSNCLIRVKHQVVRYCSQVNCKMTWVAAFQERAAKALTLKAFWCFV